MTLQTKGQAMYLAGEWVASNRWIEVCNPGNNEVIDYVPAASITDVEQAIEAAKLGSKRSAALPVHERMRILQAAAQYIADYAEEYAETIAKEGSKTITEARKEVRRCIETLRISAEEARRIKGETIPFDQMPGSENRVGYFERFPIGIIAAITPFNDPLNLVAHKVGPAIAGGNAIIVKPATVTPLSALKLAEAFHHAGLPKNILSIITGHASEIGDTLVTHPAIRMVSFTGGLSTGEAIVKKAGLKKVGMELGSNSPVIVLSDADVNEAVPAIISGAFWAAGQNCLGVQRVYIEDAIFSTFVSQFVSIANAYRVGDKMLDTTDMGPMITEKEAIRVEQWIQEAVAKGATLLCGGERRGAYVSPTVIANVPDDCTLAREEIFGPVVLLYRVATLEEAIASSNAVNYGLQAGIFTKDLEKAFQAIRELEVGGVLVNDSSDYRIDAMPFGGVKGSGLGREGVQFALQEMTEPKVVCFNLQQ